MARKPRTPSEIARSKPEKKTYSYSLVKQNADRLAELAAQKGLSASDLVDEAIESYLEAIKDRTD